MTKSERILRGLLSSLRNRDWNDVERRANELLDAIKQLPPPRTVGPSSLGPKWHHSVATFVCYAAISRAHAARRRRKKVRT